MIASSFPILKIVIVLGCIARVAAVLWRSPLDWLVSDGMRHWENGLLLWRPGVTQVFDPLLYQVWIAFCQAAWGDSRIGIAIMTSLLSLSLPLFWYLFARLVLPERSLALIACAVIEWFPTTLFSDCYFMNEALLLPILGMALWLNARFLKRPSLPAILLCALAWGLAMQTKTVAIPLGFAAIMFSLFKVRRIRYLVPAMLLIGCLSIPQAIRGYSVLNVYSPFALSPFNATYFISGAKAVNFNVLGYGRWEFSSPSLYEYALSPLSDWQSLRKGTVFLEVDPSRGGADWRSENERVARENINFRPALVAENIIFMFFGHEWPESHRDNLAGMICLWSRWIWVPIAVFNLFAGAGFLLYRKWEFLPFVAVTLLLALVLQQSGVSEGRYRKPLEPLLVVSTIFFMVQLRRRVWSGKHGFPELQNDRSGD